MILSFDSHPATYLFYPADSHAFCWETCGAEMTRKISSTVIDSDFGTMEGNTKYCEKVTGSTVQQFYAPIDN
jgi:hypothetical protein